MTEQEREKAAAINAELKQLLLSHLHGPTILQTAVEGLTLVRREAANRSERCFEKPLASILVQGRKHSVIGARAFDIAENQCLVSGVDLPSTSYAVEPTPETPFLSLFFHLNKQMIADLVMEMGQDFPPGSHEDSLGMAVADAEPDFLEGALRLVKLLDTPEQIPMRGGMILRELHYLLLIGPHGGILRRLHTRGTQNNRIAQAISLLRHNVAAPLRLDDLARQVHMSVSSLHRHFKKMTGFSPLQYHKQLRLYEAQRLMLAKNENAAGAAAAVGYESVTQFNREYKRLFGEPPRRDICRRAAMLPGGSGGKPPRGGISHGRARQARRECRRVR